MNTDLEQIENYLTGQLPANERQQFETALRTDPAVADALSFYLLTKQTARAEREKRRAELDALRQKTFAAPYPEPAQTHIKPLWSAPMRWAAAASIVLLLGVGWYFIRPADTPPTMAQLTDQYVTAHFMQLPTTMDGGSSGSAAVDSIKMGVGLFNKGMLAEADGIFQAVLTRQPTMDSALKYGGIVSLRRGNYDKAITLFHRLSQRTDLIANPGTFYEGLTYLKRGLPLDKEKAKSLLEEVINRNLEGKGDAQKLVTTISH